MDSKKKLSEVNLPITLKKLSELSSSIDNKITHYDSLPNSFTSRQNSKLKNRQDISRVQNAKKQFKKSKVFAQRIHLAKNRVKQSIQFSTFEKNKMNNDNQLTPSEKLQLQDDVKIQGIQTNKIGYHSAQQQYVNNGIKSNSNDLVQNQKHQSVIEKLFDKIPNNIKKNSTSSQVADNLIVKLLGLANNSNTNQANYRPLQNTNQYFKDKLIRLQSNHQEAQLDIQSEATSLWLGQLLDKCTSSSFKHFICHQMDYNQVKTYCCEQILTNILERISGSIDQKKPIEQISNQTNNTKSKETSDTSQKKRRKKITYEFKSMKFINDELGKILQHLCNKYPQTNIQGANKKVSQIVQRMNIDNWENDEYDLLRLSKVKFTLRESRDYSQQIMKFLNFIITLPYQKSKKYQKYTNLKYFQNAMNKIFSIIYYKDSKDDLSRVINCQGQFDLQQKIEKLSEQDRDYMEKVKRYTTVLIGSKISGTSKTFSKNNIRSGIIKIEDNAVARVIDKWAQQLRQKFISAQKNILNRSYRFKSADNTIFHKIGLQSKQELFKVLSQKRKKLQQFISQLKQSVYDLSFKFANNKCSDVSSLRFLSERQRRIGEFAVKMSQSSSQYFISILQKQINLLLQSVQVVKQRWLQKNKFKQSPYYEALDINLITLKIGDLLRCKVISNQQQIIRILNIFMTLNQSWDSQLIKIIRVKNRLQSGTKDILINFMFDNICPCQIQLAVVEKFSQKQQYFDKFNHFLYQLKRGYLGPIMEMSKIWSQYQSKSQTFAKQIQKTTKNKLKNKRLTDQLKNIKFKQNSQYYEYKFPFICYSCGIFCPRSNIIYFNSLFNEKIYCGNCQKLKIDYYSKQIQSLKVKFIFRKYVIRYPNLIKFIDKIYEISSIPDLLKHEYQIHIPINSHLIHIHFSMLIKMQNSNKNADSSQYAFVNTYLNEQGQIIKQICTESFPNEKNSQSIKSLRSLQKIQQEFQQDYVMFGWDIPTKLIPLPELPGHHYFQMIDKLLPSIHKLQMLKGKDNVKVAAVQLQQNRYYFFPFFLVDQKQISQQLTIQGNLQSIQLSIARKQEVLELQNKHLSNQFGLIHHNLKLKIAYTIKELYLDNNQLKNIDFIENFHKLKIIEASNNHIQKIPKIPFGLIELKMHSNKITQINSFTNQNQINRYKINLLDLSFNNIEKVQNISLLQNLQVFFLTRGKVNKLQGLPQSLVRLSFGFNNIQKIQNLENLKHLQKINIAGNYIKKIQNLEKCENISVLMLNRNQITKFQNLQGLKNLTVLHLSDSGLNSNSGNNCQIFSAFKGVRKLKRLLIQKNKIVCLLNLLGIQQNIKDNQMTSSLVELQQLIVSHNELHNIDSYQKAFPWLKIMHIDNNKIKRIDNIVKFSLMEDFYAVNNRIQVLPETGWENLFKMKSINLSDNKIKVVPNLMGLVLLRKLNLQRNKIIQIKGFPYTPVGYPDFYREINISNNLLFTKDVSQQNFKSTYNSLSQLNIQIDINILDNGEDYEKLQKVNELKQEKQLVNMKVKQTLI